MATEELGDRDYDCEMIELGSADSYGRFFTPPEVIYTGSSSAVGAPAPGAPGPDRESKNPRGNALLDFSTPMLRTNGVHGSNVRRQLFPPDGPDYDSPSPPCNEDVFRNLNLENLIMIEVDNENAECEQSYFEKVIAESQVPDSVAIEKRPLGNVNRVAVIPPTRATVVLPEHPVKRPPPAILKRREGEGESKSRRIAQLVVWRKNQPTASQQAFSSKENVKEKVLQFQEQCQPSTSSAIVPAPKPVPVLPPVPRPQDQVLQPQEAARASDCDLFVVQYPVRPLTETTKNKGKSKKRYRRPSPPFITSPSPLDEEEEGKKKCRKQKRSSSILLQGAPSGRAYRSYLHACLERQRQQMRTGSDFKVEKLFQPDQGVVLPGEVLPAIPEPANCGLEFSATEISDPSLIHSLLHSNSAVVQSSRDNPVGVTVGNLSTVVSLSSREPTLTCATTTVTSETASQVHDPILVPSSSRTCTEIYDNPSCSGGGALPGVEGREFVPLFELPDRFTVTTEPVNEFDLLIQSVIREEMVDSLADEEEMMAKSERCRKRVKLSNSSSRASSEERMIDDPGKPRCTYTELIEKALTETGGLTVSEIYTWISERYPFYKPDDDRWKNSVRHNLSINPYFKKGEKARNGAGHLWTISEESKGLRPSMVSWDECRKSPDSSDFEMPIKSETDRAVADILGRYASEARASLAAGKEKQVGSQDETKMSKNEVDAADKQTPSKHVASSDDDEKKDSTAFEVSSIEESGATCSAASTSGNELPTFTLNELNSAQFTVDLSGIDIPEGGSINFEELVNNGRLIYIQTDPDANKENESAQAVILNESMLSELTALTGHSSHDERFQSYYADQLSLDLGFGKGDCIPSVSYDSTHMNLHACATTSAPSTFTSGSGSIPYQHDLEPTCAQLIQSSDTQSHNQTDLTSLDQVITMSSYETLPPSEMSVSIPPPTISTAALFESKELGISYSYETETSHDMLQ